VFPIHAISNKLNNASSRRANISGPPPATISPMLRLARDRIRGPWRIQSVLSTGIAPWPQKAGQKRVLCFAFSLPYAIQFVLWLLGVP
jgi:hypothetical protein